MSSQLELSEAKLANAEAHVGDLKVQLDDALGAEDMLEQLTERNLQMGEVGFAIVLWTLTAATDTL
jgi:dynactin 1